MTLPKFEDRVVMHLSSFVREGSVFRADIRIVKSGDQPLISLPVHVPAVWEFENHKVLSVLQSVADSARQMYMSTTRGLPAHYPVLQSHLAVVGRPQIWEILVDDVRVAFYERNPELFEQVFDVDVTEAGARMGLTGGQTSRYYPEDMIAEQLQESKVRERL